MPRPPSRRGSELLEAILPLMPSVAGRGKPARTEAEDGERRERPSPDGSAPKQSDD